MSLFDVIYAQVHAYPGGCEAVALRMRKMGFPTMSGDTLQKKVKTTCDTHHLRVDEMLVIMEIVDTDDFAKEIASSRHLLCIPRVMPEEISDDELMRLLLERGDKMGRSDQELREFISGPRKNLKKFHSFKKRWRDASEVRALIMQHAEKVYLDNGGKPQ